jgi:hypothetical protein
MHAQPQIRFLLRNFLHSLVFSLLAGPNRFLGPSGIIAYVKKKTPTKDYVAHNVFRKVDPGRLSTQMWPASKESEC